MTTCQILQGHVIDKLREMPARSVHCVVTSPPYWGLRAYGTEPQIWGGKKNCAHDWNTLGTRHRGGQQGESGQRANRDTSAQDTAQTVQCGDTCTICGAWRGELGLEPTPGLYKEHMLAVFREVYRVLCDDGTLWLNLGDTYAGSGRGGDTGTSGLQGSSESQDQSKAARKKLGSVLPAGLHEQARQARQARQAGQVGRAWVPAPHGYKQKDMVGIPWMIAFALRDDGWYLRSEIVWAKPNPMPESCSDRPTKSHEQIFLFAKRPRYFYDAFAAREQATGTANSRGSGVNPKAKLPNGWDTDPGAHGSFHRNGRGNGTPQRKQNESFSATVCELVSDRNWRDVWPITTEAYSGAHYATFPREIARRCIVAGTSEGGCCAKCGAPLERIVEDGKPDLDHQRACGGDVNGEYDGTATKDYAEHGAQDPSAVKARILAGMVEKKTTGWRRTCDCETQDVKPCTVLDIFGGSGTVGEVAEYLGRNAVLIELHPNNVKLCAERTAQPGLALHC